MQKNAVLQSLDTNSCDPHSHEPREFCVGIVLYCTVLYCTVLHLLVFALVVQVGGGRHEGGGGGDGVTTNVESSGAPSVILCRYL